jgi:hypothetical protein
VQVRGAEHVHDAPAQEAHRHLLEPSGRLPRADDHDLGAVRLAQARGEGRADLAGRQVLILYVDEVACGGHRVAPEGEVLLHGRLGDRVGAGEREACRGQLVAGTGRPRTGHARRLGQGAPRAAPPALAEEPSDRAGRFALDEDLRVVHGAVCGALRVGAARVDRQVLGRVPAAVGEVDAAAERERVVDHDELLVVAPAERNPVVVAEAEAWGRAPVGQEDGAEAAANPRARGGIPGQHVHAQPLLPGDERAQERLEGRAPPLRGLGSQLRDRVDHPARDVHGVFGLLEGRQERREVVAPVHEDPHARVGHDHPGVVARPKEVRADHGAATLSPAPEHAVDDDCRLHIVQSATAAGGADP